MPAAAHRRSFITGSTVANNDSNMDGMSWIDGQFNVVTRTATLQGLCKVSVSENQRQRGPTIQPTSDLRLPLVTLFTR